MPKLTKSSSNVPPPKKKKPGILKKKTPRKILPSNALSSSEKNTSQQISKNEYKI